MFNGFLKAQGYPKSTHFDPTRPSETISNLIDYIAKHHLSVKIDSRQYVKPAVGYSKELLKLGQARGLLQFNATDLSNKLTDTLNLEVSSTADQRCIKYFHVSCIFFFNRLLNRF